MRRVRKVLLMAVRIYVLLAVIAGVLIAEASLRLRKLPLRYRQQVAETAERRYQARLEDVSIRGSDGALLKAWYVRPAKFNGCVVVMTHGITDNREGVAGYSPIFLDRGYAVLLPDARAHGESGGEFATYGVREADDLHRWVSFLYERDPPRCVYGFGESYGAALLLQSLAVEPRFCAMAVEDSFSSAREMSYERVSGPLHVGDWFGRTAGRPVIWMARAYARLRYGIDLLQPSPLEALRNSRVPVLLIHGEEDRSINPRHAMMLAAAGAGHVQLWLVPRAWHTGAWSVAHEEFEARVTGWFAGNYQMPGQGRLRCRYLVPGIWY